MQVLQCTLLLLLIKSASLLKLASFNIQVFGVKKMKVPEVPDILTKILRRYDLIVIQEIRDSSGRALPSLVDFLRKTTGIDYRYRISKRMGRTNSKEQYAVIYRPEVLTVVPLKDIADAGNHFERRPWNLLVKPKENGIPNFGLVVVHLDPDDVEAEMEALYHVSERLRKTYNLQNLLLAGDMNADCGYLSNKKMYALKLFTDNRYQWLIEDKHDTTVGRNTCAYDRLIIMGEEIQRAVRNGSAQAYRFQDNLALSYAKAKMVSDHFPVELELEA